MDEHKPRHHSDRKTDQARAVAIRDGITAAVAEDPRTRPLFQSWEEQVHQLVVRGGSAPDDILYRVVTTLSPSAAAFVRERLRAPVYAELLGFTLPDVFARDLASRERWEWPERPEGFGLAISAPSISKTFTTTKGDTIDRARQRLEEFTREIKAELDAAARAAKGGGRMPGMDTDHLSRSGRWLYDLEIREEPRPTPYALEREYHETRKASGGHGQAFPHCGCSGSVGKAIRTAKRYLGMSTTGN